MEEVIITVGTKIAESLVDPITRHARYFLCLRKFDESLRNEKSQLESKLASVKEREKVATNRAEEITGAVKKWLNEVKDILEDVKKLEERVAEAKGKCFNVSFKYSLAKQVACKTQQMVKLINECQFEPFSLPVELEGMHYFSSKDFVYFESTKSACSELLHAIKDDGINMIGLCGIGGSGKTSLAKEVGKKIEELKLFDKVIMVVVSQPLNIKNIQDQISDQLNLEFNRQSVEGRARQMSQKLRDGRTLIILDDVWEVINLEDVGIPSSDNKGCCVLLTTRLRRVCSSMGCQSTIELSTLTEEEAWALFKQRADITNDSPNKLQGVARNIADECKGLPIAIVTVGSTLKGKGFVEWELALSRLKESQPMDIEEGLRSPYVCLKLSYDNLRNTTAKSLFLLCSVFPEDHNINKEDLVRYGKGIIVLGETVDTMEKVRREIYVAINILLDSCLLMPNETQESVKMHDLVRDVALWIATEESQAIIVASEEVPKMLMGKETVKDTKVISLWDLGEKFKLFDQFHCPTLRLLLLHSQELQFEEPNIYLGGMKELRVLALKRFCFEWSIDVWSRRTWPAPQSIKSLTNLHTLCLRGNALGDISFLVTLEELEILDLRGSSFDELPIGIEEMKKLKLLDLYRCSIKKSPYEVIGKCSQLQELYIWDDKSPCPENVSFPKLQRYAVCVCMNSGAKWDSCLLEYDVGDTEASRALCLEGYNVSTVSSSMNDLFLRADILQLHKCRCENKDYLSSKVKHLMFDFFPGIKFVVDRIKANANILETEQVFSHLVTLILDKMPDLEQVFEDSSINCSLQNLQCLFISECPQMHNISFPKASNLCNLKKLHLSDCPMLKSALFTPSIAQTLVLLEELEVYLCTKLKHIIAEHEEEENVDGNSNQGSSLLAFQNLRRIRVSNCDELESILPLFSAWSLVRLEFLQMNYCNNLKWVSLNQRNEINIPALTILSLHCLPELIGPFPQQCGPRTMEKGIVWVVVTTTFNQLLNQILAQPLQAFLNWKFLWVVNSGRCEGLFELKVGEVADGEAIKEVPLKLTSDLSDLRLDELPELEFIWKGPKQILSLQRLKIVNIYRCPKLKVIFTSTIVTSLPELRELDVQECNEWERIMSTDSLPNLSASSHVNACFPKLSQIVIYKCNKLKCLFSYSLASHCPLLTQVEIRDCSEVERVVDEFEGKTGDEGRGHEVQLLFPKLTKLTLEGLTKLTEIFPGFEYDNSLHHIEDCPNFRSRRIILLE